MKTADELEATLNNDGPYSVVGQAQGKKSKDIV